MALPTLRRRRGSERRNRMARPPQPPVATGCPRGERAPSPARPSAVGGCQRRAGPRTGAAKRHLSCGRRLPAKRALLLLQLSLHHRERRIQPRCRHRLPQRVGPHPDTSGGIPGEGGEGRSGGRPAAGDSPRRTGAAFSGRAARRAARNPASRRRHRTERQPPPGARRAAEPDAAEKERSRVAATQLDRAAKLDDLVRKYSLKIRIQPRDVLAVSLPVREISARLIRKKAERSAKLHWNPKLGALESPWCEGCSAWAHP